MESKPSGQRRFAIMGDNAFRIANKLVHNQTICRLLKYQVRDPLDSSKYPDVDGVELINKQILIIPKIYDDSTEKMSYVVAVFDNFVIDNFNPEFKRTTLRFDIACPYDEWMLDDKSLRPYLLMHEIDYEFNQQKLAGIGTLQFTRATALTLSPQIGGYSLWYNINEFN